MSPTDNIGILYSTATGIVLRTINPTTQEQGHFTWLQNNLPSGTSLLLINKQEIGADDSNCPNLDTIIPFVQQKNSIIFSYGVNCSIIDQTNTVISSIICAPELLSGVVNANIGHSLIQKSASIGDIYNPLTQTFSSPVTTGTLT